MVKHLLDDLVRHRGNVGTGQGTVGYMDGIAHTGGDDLSLDVRIVQEYIMDSLDQINARLADVIETPQKRADIRGARAGCQQRLVGAENQRAVRRDALAGQHLDGL